MAGTPQKMLEHLLETRIGERGDEHQGKKRHYIFPQRIGISSKYFGSFKLILRISVICI